jgi:hypothetical protein
MLIALHEAATKRAPSKIQPLHNPDPSHQNHQDTDEAADRSHHRVECTTHRTPWRQKVCVQLLREHIEKLLNSGLLSMFMRLAYISVGLSPIRTELHFRGNFRIGGYSSEMPIPSTDFVGSNNRSNAKSDHRMLIDADSPASSKAVASPSLSCEHSLSTCCRLVSSFLTEMVQQIHSLRASGVMSSQAASAFASDASAFRRSAEDYVRLLRRFERLS